MSDRRHGYSHFSFPFTSPSFSFLTSRNYDCTKCQIQWEFKFNTQKLCWGTWVAQLVECPLQLRSGHGLTTREFEPRVGLCADSSEPGACFGFCLSLSLSLCPFPTRALSLSLSLKNEETLKKILNEMKALLMHLLLCAKQ